MMYMRFCLLLLSIYLFYFCLQRFKYKIPIADKQRQTHEEETGPCNTIQKMHCYTSTRCVWLKLSRTVYGEQTVEYQMLDKEAGHQPDASHICSCFALTSPLNQAPNPGQ